MRYLLSLVVFALLLSSCKIFRSNLMLKTPKDFNYDLLVDSLGRHEYIIAPNDAIEYMVYPNNGFKLIDLATINNTTIKRELDVIVNIDGTAKFPMMGMVKIGGLTIRQAEAFLQEKYDSLYVNPFVKVRITNKRVIVFPGNGGGAKVLPLANNNTTVMEAIANAGGIAEDGKAYKVKLIRANPDASKMPYVYLLDLSTIDGIMVGKSIVQAGDIIYVEPRYRPINTFNREIAPLLTLISTLLLLYTVVKAN
jgi:polysaccharide export outer membrane protein